VEGRSNRVGELLNVVVRGCVRQFFDALHSKAKFVSDVEHQRFSSKKAPRFEIYRAARSAACFAALESWLML
jgi:hypothetical protein